LDNSCQYVPSDIVKRSSDTVICDLNDRPLPDLTHVHSNVAVFAGVIEYVRDVDTAVAWLSQLVVVCILSYDCFPSGLKLVGRLRERLRRMYYGYLSDFSEDELRDLFRRRGFVNTRTDSWNKQRIFVFAREAGVASPSPKVAAACLDRLGVAQ
jgi:hypothetical protein